MDAQAEVPKTHPMRAAWDGYMKDEEYANTRKWAAHEQHVDGSLWAAFCKGWEADKEGAGARSVLPPDSDLAQARQAVEMLVDMIREGQGQGVLEALRQMPEEQIVGFAFYLLTEESKRALG